MALNALYHGPKWQQCAADVLRERVLDATWGDGWVVDGTCHSLFGELGLERAETLVSLDLPL